MSAKLTFNDIENAELDPSKLNFDSGFSNALNSGTVNPSLDSAVGSLYINTTSGSIFRKTATGASNWVQISSVTTSVLVNRYRAVTQTSAITSTDGSAPVIGDLVGYLGAGAWAASGVLSIAKQAIGGNGAQGAAFVAGGSTTTATNAAELFNGSTWATTGSLSVAKSGLGGAGSQNAGIIAGGVTVSAVGLSEVFNGSIWANSAIMPIAKYNAATNGTQMATLISCGNTGGTAINAVALFNGSAWSTGTAAATSKEQPTGVGSQNAAIIAGGVIATATSFTEVFNGSTWSRAGSLSIAKYGSASAGSQSSAILAGGRTDAAVTNVSELFNGSAWSTGTVISVAKSYMSGAGSQNTALIAGGSTATVSTNVTELHSQTTFRKVFSKNYSDSKNVGILTAAGTVLLQGTNSSVTYPANKYLVVNRGMNASTTNYANLGTLSFGNVLGTAPTMTYNLSSTANLLSVIPGMIAVVTASGGTPASAANIGTFIISRVISPNSLELVNASGVSQNPATGTISIISTMLAVDARNPQDIVIGRTDAAGLLTIQKPLTVGNLLRRLK